MKILKIIGGFAVLGAVVFFGGTAVLAQDRDTSGPTIVPPPIVIPAIPTPGTVRNVPPPPPDADRNRMRNTVNLSERETEAAKKLAERRAEAEKRRLEVGAEIEKRQEEARLKMEKARADAQIKALERKRELESRVTQIRDEQKKRMAEQLATQFDRINKNWTDHFSNVLDQLDEVLGKIRTRAEKASANGADVSSVNAAITAAQTSIATARAAGQAADIIATPANPLENIQALRQVHFVMKDGKIIKQAE